MAKKRSFPVNHLLIAELRAKRGWTQDDLAKAAGYSTRLIRKAERGGSLDANTIRDIAMALSDEQTSVTVEQLTVNCLTIAKEWMNAFELHEVNLVSAIEKYLTDDFVLICPGDKSVAPFIGQWHGAAGLEQWARYYFQVFKRLPATDVSYAIGENSVIIRFLETCYIQDQLCGPVRVNMHFQFRDGLICRIDDDYDTSAGAKAKSAAEQRLNLKNGQGDSQVPS